MRRPRASKMASSAGSGWVRPKRRDVEVPVIQKLIEAVNRVADKTVVLQMAAEVPHTNYDAPLGYDQPMGMPSLGDMDDRS